MDRRSFLGKTTAALSGTLIAAGVSAKIFRSHGKERAPDTLQDRVRKLCEMKEIACVPGTVDYDPYFQGMANGMIVALSIMNNDEPSFVGSPKEWGYERREGGNGQ